MTARVNDNRIWHAGNLDASKIAFLDDEKKEKFKVLQLNKKMRIESTDIDIDGLKSYAIIISLS